MRNLGVKRAANEYTVKYSLADLFDGKVIENSSQYYQGAAEIAAYRNSFDSAPVDAGEAASIEDTIRTDGLRISDTGQIKRDIKRGILTINTPGTEVVQGFLKGVEAEFAALTIQTDNEFAVFSFSSVDKAEINSARRFLFTAVARADNSNMIYNASRRKALTKGNAPIIVEPVAAAVQLRLDGKFRVWALNEVGERKTEVPVENNRFQISDQYKTIWYEIVKD